jgi:hypothetical protein
MSLLNVKYLYFFAARPVESIESILFHKSKNNINRGTGAGGKATNHNGKKFEELTNNEPRLLSQGFIKKHIEGKKGKFQYYFEKQINEQQSVIYMTQTGLKCYMKHTFQLDLTRHPDEAYLFRNDNQYTLKIIEKKFQSAEGSVEEKLSCGNSFIREYLMCLDKRFTVQYGFCLSSWLFEKINKPTKKNQIRKQIRDEDGVVVFCGDEHYFEKLEAWLYQ